MCCSRNGCGRSAAEPGKPRSDSGRSSSDEGASGGRWRRPMPAFRLQRRPAIAVAPAFGLLGCSSAGVPPAPQPLHLLVQVWVRSCAEPAGEPCGCGPDAEAAASNEWEFTWAAPGLGSAGCSVRSWSTTCWCAVPSFLSKGETLGRRAYALCEGNRSSF